MGQLLRRTTEGAAGRGGAEARVRQESSRGRGLGGGGGVPTALPAGCGWDAQLRGALSVPE